jgi:hypothetical protein
MDERLHPFRGFASAYQVLADVAARKGWKIYLQLTDEHGLPLHAMNGSIAAIAHRQVVLEGHGFIIREREEHPGSSTLDELANALLERVQV